MLLARPQPFPYKADSMSIPKRHLWAIFPTAIAASFLLGGYEFIRSPSNTLFKVAYGVENFPTIMAIMPLGIMLTLYIYGKILSRLKPRKTLLVTTLASAVLIVLCYLAIHAGVKIANALIYIIRESYVMIIIEQYWSFINSSVSDETGKKLNGPLIGISSLGAIAGGLLLGEIAEPFGTLPMLLIAAASLLPAAYFSDLAYQKCGEPPPDMYEKREHPVLGLKHFKTEPILAIILGIVLLTQIISAVLFLSFQGILEEAIPQPDQQTAFSGRYFALINTVAAVLQFVGVPILLRFLSLRVVHLIMPVLMVTACAFLTASPTLAMAGTAYLLFKCFDYSLFRAAKELLYIPLTYIARYRAKEVIDVFGYRTGKGGISLLITVMEKVGFALTSFYSIIAMAAAGLWLVLVFPMTKKTK